MTATLAFTPRQALGQLLAAIDPVPSEQLLLHGAAGRVLSEPVRADRDSPAADVSAMDGYAVRLAELLKEKTLPVDGEVATGRAPQVLPVGRVLRIFTGGCIPPGADTVVRREDLLESIDAIRVNADTTRWQPGMNIRRQGENLAAGERVLDAGIQLKSPYLGAAALFGKTHLQVHRALRVAVLVTGDEVLAPGAEAQPWQVRDANGPALLGLLDKLPWVRSLSVHQGRDSAKDLIKTVQQLLAENDALLLTGGVSMGDHDYVPQVIRESGAQIMFHKLPIRPGKPVLGAVGPQGQPVLGLPGNPVSVLCTAVRFALPALRKRAGFLQAEPRLPVSLSGKTIKPVSLWSFRPVRLNDSGEASVVSGKGSGDLASAAQSDGFVEMPPDETHTGPWPFYPWSAS